jgi:hypothetical protein
LLRVTRVRPAGMLAGRSRRYSVAVITTSG